MCWTKRGKRARKDASSEEDKRNLLARIEELERKLEEKDATICGLEKILQEKNMEMEEVEVTLNGKIMELNRQRKIERLAGWNEELKLHLKIGELRAKVVQEKLDKINYERKQREGQHKGYCERKKEERYTKNRKVVDTVINTMH